VARHQTHLRKPDTEDREWFPEIAGSNWRDTFEFAMQNFKDESFIAQYLSPQLMREFRFFSVLDDDARDKLQVEAIHDERGYRTCASNSPSSTTWAAASPISRSGMSICAATGH
jgi:spore cortex formation protein SpoVR/YcgB (stage V sporulation)